MGIIKVIGEGLGWALCKVVDTPPEVWGFIGKGLKAIASAVGVPCGDSS